MDRVAVFVDAGYVFAQGSSLLAGRKLPRAEIILAHEAAVRAFGEFATKISHVPLLRVYWYDGTSTGPTAQHLTLADLQDVKVRLGFVNSAGQQKGVDSLIVTDMITLARNRAISDAVLVSGDEDLRVGVQQAQEFGVRVHLVGIKPSRGSQSLFLLQEADTTHEWATDEISSFLKCQPNPPMPESGGAGADSKPNPAKIEDPLRALPARIAAKLQLTETEAVVESVERVGQVPRDIDAQLLAGARSAIGRELSPAEKKEIRKHFLEACRARM
ncbi:MAG: NYN domain-containing protein [Bryobacteraceae bacterium]